MSSIEPQMIANDYYKLLACVPNSRVQSQTNHRIYDRNIPSQPLQAYLNVRPVMTKYSILPIVDPRAAIKVPMIQLPTYSTEQVFNPGNTVSSWSGYASNVNIESQLRNQIYSINKCNDDVYVPSSKSDLYTYNFNTKTQTDPHYLLYQNVNFDSFNPNPNPAKIGTSLFLNSTRIQVKEMTNSC
jgi:hypothetical protein